MYDLLTNKGKWILAGYRQFGEIGPEALNVEKLSLIVGLNRSSFYHYFGEIGLYEGALLDYHIDRFKSIGKIIEGFNDFHDMLRSVVNFRDEIKFHRQLLIHQKNKRYAEYFHSARTFTEDQIIALWMDHSPEDITEEEHSLYNVVRDYFLIHFDQVNEEEIEKSMQDIRLLMYEKHHS